jgi:hypothetical protein
MHYARRTNDAEALKEIKRASVTGIPDSLLKKYLWNGALIGYLNADLSYAKRMYTQYDNTFKDSSLNSALLKVLVHANDADGVRALIQRLSARDSLFSCLSCIDEVRNYERKGALFYTISSAVIPGSGAIMNGYPVKGIVSLALTAASVFGVVSLVRDGLYLNAVLWGSGIGLKFYGGNIRLTQTLFERRAVEIKRKRAVKCAAAIQRLTNKYPLILSD